MRLHLGDSGFESCPITWQNMVTHVRDSLGVSDEDQWEDGWVLLNNYLYENFRGQMDHLDENVTCVEFESEAHFNWFVLRFS